METSTTHEPEDGPRIDPAALPTGGGEALDLTVSSTSRGERSDSIPTGGGEMLTDLGTGATDDGDQAGR